MFPLYGLPDVMLVSLDVFLFKFDLVSLHTVPKYPDERPVWPSLHFLKHW